MSDHIIECETCASIVTKLLVDITPYIHDKKEH